MNNSCALYRKRNSQRKFVLLDVTPCSLVKLYRRFRETGRVEGRDYSDVPERFLETTPCYNAEDNNVCNHHSENLKNSPISNLVGHVLKPEDIIQLVPCTELQIILTNSVSRQMLES